MISKANRLDELNKVERPLIEQLQSMEWDYIEGDTDVPELTERSDFRHVLLFDRLRTAIRRINRDDDGEEWLDDSRIERTIEALQRLGPGSVIELNQRATELLVTGVPVEGDPDRHGERDVIAHFIDFDEPSNNDFLVVNQLRVDRAGKRYIPDLVLFVNGIPLVVIECKSPKVSDPMREGIRQLLRYSNQREEVEEDEGCEQLFYFNQLVVSTYYYQARAAALGTSYADYVEWKDTTPTPTAEVTAALSVDKLTSQQTLVAGMLRPENLLDIVRNFILFESRAGRTVKHVPRYQQFRLVHSAIQRLQTGQTRIEHGLQDQRGGVAWHTQGSGKSYAMVFLVRKMRTLPNLRRFKVVMVTNRRALEKQLSGTLALTGESVRRSTSSADLKAILREAGPDLVFGMIQKYRDRADEADFFEPRDVEEPETGVEIAPEEKPAAAEVAVEEPEPPFGVLNESEEILVLIDEAHDDQAGELHANLIRALPNSARIGFTGTPIMIGEQTKTRDIFGEFIDRPYTIKQSEADGATVPILYEGRTAEGIVPDREGLDQVFEDMFAERSPEERQAIKAKYVTTGNVLEAPRMIAAKAEDMLRHYVDSVLPNGFKAQLVATSRLAAIRYAEALDEARKQLVERLDLIDPAVLDSESDDPLIAFLSRAHPYRQLIGELEFAAVISHGHNDEPFYDEWSDKAKADARVERFKKPLSEDRLAFLSVKSMLLTGFDAPVEQVMYLDRSIKAHELLQAIARVNRTAENKDAGLVVDYYGVARHLTEALAVYAEEDVQEALTDIRDELPKLADRHRRVLQLFLDQDTSIEDEDACVDLLRDERLRANFATKMREFLDTLDVVLPRPEALAYTRDARRLGFISQAARNLYRDPQLGLVGAKEKVRRLVDEYVDAKDVELKIAAISILDVGFADSVEAQTSPRAKASKMEHAARDHIRVHIDEDPVFYGTLSDRLEAIIEQLEDNWEELLPALEAVIDEMRAGRPEDESGLDPRTQVPFLDVLRQAAPGPVEGEELQRYAGLTTELVQHIRQEVQLVDFWRNAYAQDVLRRWIVGFLDDHDLMSFSDQRQVADRLVELAKALHVRLIQ